METTYVWVCSGMRIGAQNVRAEQTWKTSQFLLFIFHLVKLRPREDKYYFPKVIWQAAVGLGREPMSSGHREESGL